MEENPTPSLVNHAAKWGGILAIASIFVVMVLYAVDYTLMAGFTFILLMLAVGVAFVIYAGINYRNSIGGYIPFGKAFLHGLLVFAIAGIISTGFNLLLYYVIDPELPENLTEAIITNTEETMANWGAPQESIDQAIDKMREDMPKNFTVGGLVKGYFTALIWYVILSLITGLIVKKNQPEMM
jgi:hypothetical protein